MNRIIEKIKGNEKNDSSFGSSKLCCIVMMMMRRTYYEQYNLFRKCENGMRILKIEGKKGWKWEKVKISLFFLMLNYAAIYVFEMRITNKNTIEIRALLCVAVCSLVLICTRWLEFQLFLFLQFLILQSLFCLI